MIKNARKDYCISGENFCDETDKLESALLDMEGRGGGTLVFDSNMKIGLSRPLYSHTGVLFQCDNANDLSTNTNGSGAPSTIIRWVGEYTPGYMYEISPLTLGECIWGGGSKGIEWDCSGLAAGAVHLDNTKEAYFFGKVRSPAYIGVLVDSRSGVPGNFSQNNHLSLQFVYGASALTENAHGLFLAGNGTNVPSTQQYVYSVTGLTANGFGLVVAETDNCKIAYVNIARIGNGGSIQFRNGGAQPANANVVQYVAGRVDHGNGLYGNRTLHAVSEGGGFSGNSQWDGDILDYVTARLFTSHKYSMRKWLNFSSGDFMGDYFSDSALQWRSLTLPNGISRSSATATLPTDYDLANGAIETLELTYTTNGSADGNVILRFKISCVPLGGSLVNPQHTWETSVPQAATYKLSRFSYPIFPTLLYNKGDTILVSVIRISDSILDTSQSSLDIIGLRLNYKSKGPDSHGSGTFNVPDWN